MPDQRRNPTNEFLEKLNRHVDAYIGQQRARGARVTREQLAKRIGPYDRVTLHRWLSGAKPMPQAVLERLCTHIGLSDADSNELLILGGYIKNAPSAPPQQNSALPPPSVSHQLLPSRPLPSPALGNAPPLPALIIGREDDVSAIKTRLGLGGTATGGLHVLTAMKGWPGVGKTTLASALAYDPEIAQAFPDGVLWASLGQQPHLARELSTWGRILGVPDVYLAPTLEDMSAALRGVLRTQRRLLIVDDAWQAEHIVPFNVGGPGCALLVTTRQTEVARVIAPTPNDIYTLGVLSEANALKLLRTLAPTVVAEHEATSRELVNDLEGLPLAIQVAGRLLHTEASYGFGVTQLLADIREGAKLIAAQAPADRAEVANETTPTIAALLSKSTDRLDIDTLDCFAYLGAFAPKPATFDVEAMQAVWQVDEPKPTIRTLIDHGLLEPVIEGRFWMHAILVVHAKSFLVDE